MNNPIGFPGLGIEVDPDPVAFRLFGHGIHWYGIIIAVAFLLAAVYVIRRAPRVGLKGDDVIDGLLFSVPAAIIFARLYYVVFNLERFSPNNPDREGIFEIWKGGIAIYGALIGAVVTVVIFCRIRKIKFSAFVDLAAPGLLIGQCIGRWGNFINREAFGTVTTLPWRMTLDMDKIEGAPFTGVQAVHPTFLYESLWCLVGFLLLHFLFNKRKFSGQLFLMYAAWYSLGRSFIEGLRTDSLFLGSTTLRVSQLLSVLIFLASLALLAYNLFIKGYGARPAPLIEGAPAVAGPDASDETGTVEDSETEAEAQEETQAEAPDGEAEAKTENPEVSP